MSKAAIQESSKCRFPWKNPLVLHIHPHRHMHADYIYLCNCFVQQLFQSHVPVEGLVGITEPVGCMGIQSGMEMPIWLWLVFGYVIRLIIMLAYSGFFLFISNKIKSAFVTLTVMSIVIIIIFFVI